MCFRVVSRYHRYRQPRMAIAGSSSMSGGLHSKSPVEAARIYPFEAVDHTEWTTIRQNEATYLILDVRSRSVRSTVPRLDLVDHTRAPWPSYHDIPFSHFREGFLLKPRCHPRTRCLPPSWTSIRRFREPASITKNKMQLSQLLARNASS